MMTNLGQAPLGGPVCEATRDRRLSHLTDSLGARQIADAPDALPSLG